MGLAYYPTFDKTLEGFDASSVDGKVLADNFDALAEAAVRLNVPAADTFCSTSDEELEDLLGDDVPDEIEGAEWFSPRDGLRTFEALLDDVRKNPGLYKQADGLLEDLQNTVEMLKAAAAQSLQFRLTMDF